MMSMFRGCGFDSRTIVVSPAFAQFCQPLYDCIVYLRSVSTEKANISSDPGSFLSVGWPDGQKKAICTVYVYGNSCRQM